MLRVQLYSANPRAYQFRAARVRETLTMMVPMHLALKRRKPIKTDGPVPAVVQGSERSAYALFVEDEQGSLADILYLCNVDGWGSPLVDGALDWPAFEFGDSQACCTVCGLLINRGIEE